MGYACPVCATPQADATHLANHLAFTALLRSDEHEAWLDENVPGWGEHGEQELAEEVVNHAREEEFPQVFEDTVGEAGEHQHDHERSGKLFEDTPRRGRQQRPGTQPAAMDEETKAIVEEARELTEEMLREPGEESEPAGASEAAVSDSTDDSDKADER
jgi:hypothetical protein